MSAVTKEQVPGFGAIAAPHDKRSVAGTDPSVVPSGYLEIAITDRRPNTSKQGHTKVSKKIFLAMGLLAPLMVSCGGSDLSDELAFDADQVVVNNFVFLTGMSFVPEGSSCPPSSEYVRFGTLGPHTLTWHNAATGASGEATASPWVCNADGGQRTSCCSIAPIELEPGDNEVTVSMVSPGRKSSATTLLRGAAR